jgi:bifunctional aspartokinase / homoserine dehydrogenase 1
VESGPIGDAEFEDGRSATRMTPSEQKRARMAVRSSNPPTLRPDGRPTRARAVKADSKGAGKRRKPVQVMKFGGTSVADADCIRNVVKIIRRAAKTKRVVVVVSAMAGVTNTLVTAAARAEAGDNVAVQAILNELRAQHFAAAEALTKKGAGRELLMLKLKQLFDDCERLCEGTVLLRQLTPRARDVVWSLGERLSSPMLAAALAAGGTAAEAVEATDVIVTNGRHGGADPLMDLTRERCVARLKPLLDADIVPVTTGFIGASEEGVLTILGRGGSDYSATIIGAVLNADEVIIWTDVDGVLTADPEVVREARTIPEMSYREASEHAHFGAKVLHPKTLRALEQCHFPVSVRNAFAPARPGTRITPGGSAKARGVKAITAITAVSMIKVGGPRIAKVHDALGRTFAAAAAIRAVILLTSHSSAQNDICLVVPAGQAAAVAEELGREFGADLGGALREHIRIDENAALVTVVGEHLLATSGLVGRTFAALGRKKVNVLATAQGSSDCNISFVVEKTDVRVALNTAHREFRLGKAKKK